MDHTEEQLAAFKSEFARKRRNQFIVAMPVIALVVVSIFFEEQAQTAIEGLPPAVAAGAVAIAVVGLLVFSLRNWRCPACEGYLGRNTNMVHCPKCGVALK